MSGPVLIDRPAVGVVRLLINRPDKRNAIDLSVREALLDGLSAVTAESTTRALVLGGVGGIFSAGGDLPSMTGLDELGARERMRHIHGLCRAIARAPVPVVTAMEGIAAGGAVGMALLGDRIVAGQSVRILFPFLSLGLTPDWGQLLTLPQRIGLPAARRLLSSGEPVGADEAVALGLVDAVLPDAEAMPRAVALAASLAAMPMKAFTRTRARLNGPSDALDEALRREEDDQVRCLTGHEFAEGFAAFAERRRPNFSGVRADG